MPASQRTLHAVSSNFIHHSELDRADPEGIVCDQKAQIESTMLDSMNDIAARVREGRLHVLAVSEHDTTASTAEFPCIAAMSCNTALSSEEDLGTMTTTAGDTLMEDVQAEFDLFLDTISTQLDATSLSNSTSSNLMQVDTVLDFDQQFDADLVALQDLLETDSCSTRQEEWTSIVHSGSPALPFHRNGRRRRSREQRQVARVEDSAAAGQIGGDIEPSSNATEAPAFEMVDDAASGIHEAPQAHTPDGDSANSAAPHSRKRAEPSKIVELDIDTLPPHKLHVLRLVAHRPEDGSVYFAVDHSKERPST